MRLYSKVEFVVGDKAKINHNIQFNTDNGFPFSIGLLSSLEVIRLKQQHLQIVKTKYTRRSIDITFFFFTFRF